MATFDEARVTFAYQGFETTDNPNYINENELTNAQTLRCFKEFINHSQPGDARFTYHYRDQLYHNKTKLTVDLAHIRGWNANIANLLETKPAEALPLFEQAATEVLKEHYANIDNGAALDISTVQIMLNSSTPLVQSRTRSIRDLAAERVSQLVMITGIITAAAKPKHKATSITVQCRSCKAVQTLACKPGLGGAIIPSGCNQPRLPGEERCERDPFIVLPDRSQYVDQQQLKLQEKPEDVPTGEMPRHVLLISDRQHCNHFTPGTRVNVLGIYSTFKGKAMEKGMNSLQQPYIRVVSMMEEAGDSHSRFNFTQEEITTFERYARSDKIHELIFSQIAPNIFGADEIKKAVAALLFGGSRKSLPDGTNRRGDINVLLLGDPSTAKSQFLKFASKVAPISVYTSGKGSSAAGLTATVVQDPNSREFYLEGGAMVLADNGVVCIDEFDKMRPEDRVAIHEAMEQQTISIAKAGITTMLKSRTSVLAAANPPSGRYDDLKTAQENIDLQSTILSRFDLIFIVKDPADPDRDKMIARKVLDNHRTAGAQQREQQSSDAKDVDFLRRYIHYCRSQCFPRLSEQAQDRLAAFYVEIRGEARSSATRDDSETPPVPVTVRQLEAIIRISESLAKMSLTPTATLEHAEMAIQLFTKATMDAVKSGVTAYNIASDPQRERIHRLEDKIRRRVGIGSYITQKRLMEEMVALGESEMFVMRALLAMAAGGDIEFKRERSVIQRVR
ncbi:hypothetical protein CEUSTIGMA_g2079.t1 [Chlamydomonas eustigma]|uniref:DNA replication licensing factor MCM5 n=1 Tax=Chlamydomonas eustigma TaxID=1157962 RepID=A0A250WUY5_9CHLO|nr:hypothetical protein CEUSTIGMA_g2079.t1 [Chlamydomonas eustigma]|eukprot:GAX74631.1 hypothetical protein CEUSTIGMA_g2079.t1 [Chlamydomonas eustigma]